MLLSKTLSLYRTTTGLLLLMARSANAQAESCDSEAELLSSLLWLRTACPHETFDDAYTLVPRTITTVGCANAARRVANGCGSLLSSSRWFESRKVVLNAAVSSAAALSDDPAVYAIADPGATAVHTCDATVTDGFTDFATPITGISRLTIDVGPSRGHLRLTLDDSTTLDATANDNLRVYAGSEQQEEVRAIFSNDLPLADPIDVPGSVAVLLLVSDGATRHTSLRATVECVCEDSGGFEDEDGDGCSAYAQGSGPKHSTCASLLAHTDEVARDACPLACGACEPEVCATSPCLNGGTCAHGGDSGTCHASDLAARTAMLTSHCCNEPTQDCSTGQPATCNVDCASVLVPYYLDCWQMLAANVDVLAAVQSVAQQCESTQSYRCSCIDGYSGSNCEAKLPDLPDLPDGFAEMYTISGCTAEPGTWCGTYQRVAAHCTDVEAGNCQPDANGQVHPTLCDGAPVYQLDDSTNPSAPVLYRYYDNDSDTTRWYVGSEDHLATCNGLGWSCSDNGLLSAHDSIPGRANSNEGPPDSVSWGHECMTGALTSLQVVGGVLEQPDPVDKSGGH